FSSLTREKLVLWLQLGGTLAIVFFVDQTLLATPLLLFWWGVTFYPFSKRDILLFVVTSFFFTVVDIMVLQQGIFRFTDQDIWGMPYYEIFLWGFYFLHAHRLLGGSVPQRFVPGLVFSLLSMGALSLIPVVSFALVVTGGILIGALAYFRTKDDLRYTAYLLIIGVFIEFLGTKTGTWAYNIDGYVFWWVVTWAVSGLVLYRTILPLCAMLAGRFEKK
ncbi:MAG: hypothetical protein Q8O53_02460, partial [Candidatus Moranbacteria bacterium]|nr:hypothetical protein [Candidatus Moranbacteria bacterium]